MIQNQDQVTYQGNSLMENPGWPSSSTWGEAAHQPCRMSIAMLSLFPPSLKGLSRAAVKNLAKEPPLKRLWHLKIISLSFPRFLTPCAVPTCLCEFQLKLATFLRPDSKRYNYFFFYSSFSHGCFQSLSMLLNSLKNSFSKAPLPTKWLPAARWLTSKLLYLKQHDFCSFSSPFSCFCPGNCETYSFPCLGVSLLNLINCPQASIWLCSLSLSFCFVSVLKFFY